MNGFGMRALFSCLCARMGQNKTYFSPVTLWLAAAYSVTARHMLYMYSVLAICLLKDIMAGLSRCFIYTYTHICVDKPLVMSLWSGAPNGPCRNILRGFQTPLPAALILTNSLILNRTYLCVHCARGVQYLL